jgi:hypothetical protein
MVNIVDEKKPGFEGKFGNVRVPVYKRDQLKNGKVYTTYAVADYLSGTRKLWSFASAKQARDKANEIAAATANGQTKGIDWKPEQRAEIAMAMSVAESMGLGFLHAITILRDAVGLTGPHSTANQRVYLLVCSC